MQLVVITFALIAVGVVSHYWGAWKLSRFAARISGGLAAGVLLFPPVAYWFSFYKLKEEGKEFPTTMWLFGMVTTVLMIAVFWTPLTFVFQGRIAELEPAPLVSEAMTASDDEPSQPTPTEPTPAEPAPVAPAVDNNAEGAETTATGGAEAPAEPAAEEAAEGEAAEAEAEAAAE